MGAVVAIGERVRVQGFGLAGVRAVVAEDAAEVRAAWAALPTEPAVVLLTPAAAAALGVGSGRRAGDDRLVVVMPA